MHEYHHHHDDCQHKVAPECDDQLPVFSTVGRGIKGDTYRVDLIDPDTHEVTQLEGKVFDEATQTWHTEWISENINGGYLEYQYNLRPYTIPATFTITFKYHRPGKHGGFFDGEGNLIKSTSRSHADNHAFCGDGLPNDYQDPNDPNKSENNVGLDPDNECSWVWTTPAIPYIWTVDTEGGTVTNPPDHIVGSGVATLFTRTMHDLQGRLLNDNAENWMERLIYPPGWTREQFNAPTVLTPWTVNLRFGWGGDVLVPDFYDIAKIIGAPIQNIVNLLNGQSGQIDGSDNVVDYIKDWVKHIHDDMGFGGPGSGGELISDNPGATVPGCSKPATIKNYITAAKTEVTAGSVLTCTSSTNATDGHTKYAIDDSALVEMIEGVADSIPDVPPSTVVKAGSGIVVTKNGNVYTVAASSALPMDELIPGTDFEYKFFNGWQNNLSNMNYNGPEVYVNLAQDDTGYIGGNIKFDFYNKSALHHPGQLNTTSNPNSLTAGYCWLAHGTKCDNMKSSVICGIKFKGQYAGLNDLGIVTVGSPDCLWAVADVNNTSNYVSWLASLELRKTSNPANYDGCTYVLYATMFADGKNNQFSTTGSFWLDGADVCIPVRANVRVNGYFGNPNNTTANV